MRRLERGLQRRLRRSLASSSRKKLGSALRSFAGFAAGIPERALFTTSALHNEWTLMLYLEYMARTPSRRTGRVVAVDTAAGYISMLKSHFSRSYGFELVKDTVRLGHLIKQMRRTEVGGGRRKRVGLRRRHLQRVWSAGGRVTERSARAATEWAAMATAWQALARGGELTCSKFDARRHPSRADLSFDSGGGRRWATLLLRPLKKKGSRVAEKVPILFEEGDHGGADTYYHLKRMLRYDPTPPGRAATTPLFRRGQGSMRLEHLRRAFKRTARAAGLDAAHVGAHSGRIGGATDVAEASGSPLLLQAKGRWGSDIGKIYARMTRQSQLAASRMMQQRGGGRDLEEIFPTFTQPSA